MFFEVLVFLLWVYMLFDMPVHLLLWISQFLVNLLVLELKQPDELLVLKQGLLDTLTTVLFSMTGLLGGQVVMFFD
jgi:hypothetical protein